MDNHHSKKAIDADALMPKMPASKAL
ncbi:hypothetical protein SPV1_04868 [Mariprofundus ferrooxydans PV-1]|uniref:Uncharacterized protein n=1 Tax=Mariprofundus ferrooxydans PV-1 TaxID=314345 RepID=Q0F317_9PROT|nr:hypothetical protein SPV1_04868 [Mariprofundus ferrooxydans PV-1]